MTITHNPSPADQVDNQRRLLALAMLLLALIFGIKTTFYLVNEQTEIYLGFIAKGLAVLLFINLIVLVYWKLRFIPKTERYLLSTFDSFVNHAFNRACLISWILTLVLLEPITTMTSNNSSAFPTEFYLNLTLFFMLAVFSVSFFILFRTNESD